MGTSLRGVIEAGRFAWLASLAMVAATVVARRLSGAFDEPLHLAPLAALGAVLAVFCLAGRAAWARRHGESRPNGRDAAPIQTTWREQAVRWTPLAACLAIALAVLLPATPTLGACVLVLVLAVEETWGLARPAWRERIPALSAADEVFPFLEDDGAEQRSTRRLGALGMETVTGMVRLRFAAGQRTAESHVAFCPPLPCLPEIEFSAASGPPARLTIGQLLPQGVRFDAKLAQASASATSMIVRFVARSGAAPSQRAVG